MIKFLTLSLLILANLTSKNVNIIAPFCPFNDPGALKNLSTYHHLTCTCPMHVNFNNLQLNLNSYDAYVFFDLIVDTPLPKDQKDKCILINMEPRFYKPSYFDNYNQVYTWNDELIDHDKFIKLYYPVLEPMMTNIPSFIDKKFCCMIASNWVSHRLDCLEYFTGYPNLLDVFGKNLPYKFSNSMIYKGPITGGHSSNEKFEILKNYKYCLCFENTLNAKGYITEKIFHCFKSGCIPIYSGASNVTDYIPDSCYIDLRKFPSYDDLITYLKSIDEEKYNRILQNINNFLSSPQAQVFAYENFENTIHKLIQQTSK